MPALKEKEYEKAVELGFAKEKAILESVYPLRVCWKALIRMERIHTITCIQGLI